MKIQFKNSEITVFESALFRTTTTLITASSYVLLVDPNWLPIELEFIENYINSYHLEKDKYLLFTHSDYDHIIGYGKFKHYKTIASQNFVNNRDKETTLQQIRAFDDEYYIKRGYVIEYPRIDFPIAGESEELQLGQDEYLFYQATGHNKDGLLAYNTSKHLLIAGDYLSNIEFPYIYDSWKNYLKTLDTFEGLINQLPIKILVTGHGDMTASLVEMKTRLKDSRTYISDCITAIQNKKIPELSRWISRYDFPIGMNTFHKNNLKLIEKELE